MKRIHFISKIIRRILCLPFVAIIGLIHHLIWWLTQTILFVFWGGEVINYTKNHNARTILDNYVKLEKLIGDVEQIETL